MPRRLVAKEVVEPVARLKIPTTLGACADLFYKTQQRRLALEAEAAKVAKDEAALKEHIINTLPKSDANGITGKLCRVTIRKTLVPTVSDWDQLYAYVLKTKDFSLLERRIGKAAVRERWEARKEVPGVEGFNVVTLSVSKL
jgi:hypothetical protein